MIQLRKRMAELLEANQPGDLLGRIVDIFLIGLISLNVVAIIMESESAFEAQYGEYLYTFEVFSVLVFTVEYILRVWSCLDRPGCADTRPVMGRIRYMLTLSALIDLIAILPFYLAFFFVADLRFLRVIRLLRVFKLTRYSAAMQVLLDVLQDEFNTFMAAFFLLAVLLVLASSGIYLIEQDAQPDAFGSIPLAMWWSLVTLTTVGYGDVTPVTTLGKFFGGCITVIGVGMVALPAGILASGFGEHLQRRRETYKELLDDVLEDGIVTEEEETELEMMREKLELSHEDAEQLFTIMVRESEGIITSCPHCGKSLKEIIRK